MRFGIFVGKPTPEQVNAASDALRSCHQTAQDKFLAAMAEYHLEKMEKDNRKKVCFVTFHEGCFLNLSSHCVLLCSPKMAFTHIKGFPESVLQEYGDLDDELRIRIHFLGKVDGDTFYAHTGFSRRIPSQSVREEEVPENRECFPHVLTTIMVPMKNLLELEGSDTAIRNYAREKCAETM